MPTPTIPLTADPEIMYKLGQIEAKLEAIDDKLDTKEKDQDARLDKHEIEIAALKKREVQLITAAGILALAASFLMKVIPWQSLLF